MIPGSHTVLDDVAALRTALAAEQVARREAEAMVAHLKLLIAKLRHEQFGASSERGRKLLDQLELQLEKLEAGAAEDDAALDPDPASAAVRAARPGANPCGVRCPRTCRASAWCCLARPPARVARASCPSWAELVKVPRA